MYEFKIPPPSPVVLNTELGNLVPVSRGKVRDCYLTDDGRRVFVATDRISAFDVIMPNGIPDKGRVLTHMSLFWFQLLHTQLANMGVKHHLKQSLVQMFPEEFWPYKNQLQGRSMLVQNVDILPVECIVRGYLTGSGKKEYDKSGTVCKIPLPTGLVEASKLPDSIFTPSTKAETGHDMNISFDEGISYLVKKLDMSSTTATELMKKLRDVSIAIYSEAAEYASTRGIIIADTKFEFGIDPLSGNLTLADEVLTPDSSRFWDATTYEPGKVQDSFDKQFLRNYLESINYNKEPPAPFLPEEIVQGTRERYLEAYFKLTGKNLPILV